MLLIVSQMPLLGSSTIGIEAPATEVEIMDDRNEEPGGPIGTINDPNRSDTDLAARLDGRTRGPGTYEAFREMIVADKRMVDRDEGGVEG